MAFISRGTTRNFRTTIPAGHNFKLPSPARGVGEFQTFHEMEPPLRLRIEDEIAGGTRVAAEGSFAGGARFMQNPQMPSRGPSIPEHIVLGVVWREGPCTTYQVMKVLADSPSSFFRKRASSTYALAEKLLKRGLLEYDDDHAGPRGDRQLRISKEGLARLCEWMVELPDLEVSFSNDLVRQRTNFLDVLSAPEKLEFVDRALQSLRKLLAEYEQYREEKKNAANSLSVLGLIYETRARVEWLEEVRRQLNASANG